MIPAFTPYSEVQRWRWRFFASAAVNLLLLAALLWVFLLPRA